MMKQYISYSETLRHVRIIRLIKSRMRWAGNLAWLGGGVRYAHKLLVGRERDHYQDVDGWIILRWILER
jgi:hypothetical protein